MPSFLKAIVQSNEPLTERTIKDIHAIILRGIDQENAGVYRTPKVLIGGEDHIPPDPLQVPDQMEDMISWYDEEGQNLSTTERAAILHSEFVKIHPFINGNGRTARLLLNLELMSSDYVPIVIKSNQRADYYQALDRAHTTGDNTEFIIFVGNILKNTLEFYLDFLGE